MQAQGRPKYQQGSIQRRGNQWVLKFYEDRGNGVRVRVIRALAAWNAHPFRTPLSSTDEKYLREKLADKINQYLAPVNEGRIAQDTIPSLGDFIEKSFFPRLEWRGAQPDGTEFHIEPSTIKGYHDLFDNHIKPRPEAGLTLRQFDSRTAQRFLESLPQNLTHQTHMHVKNFLSGVFRWAIQDGALSGVNPINGSKVGGQTKAVKHTDVRRIKIQASNKHAYALKEVADMLDNLEEPARTVCAVAAFTGLSRSELRGLQWQDYDGKTIKVQRKVWKALVGPTKTEAREAGVPVIHLLQKILDKYKKAHPSLGEGWIFRGEKLFKPLNLDNLSRRDIPDQIDGAWFGWHAFRRGLGSRLNELGVDTNTIQAILRHANISTTQAYYIIPDQSHITKAMQKLDKVLRTKYGIKP
jgi:integrase